MCLVKDSNLYQIDFTVQFKTQNCYLPGINMTPIVQNNDHAMITTMDLHKSLGHPNVGSVLKTAKNIGIDISDHTMDVCEDCELSK